jgi:hypothetical protein
MHSGMSAVDKDHLWVTERPSPGQNDFQDDLQPPASHIDQLKDVRRQQQVPGSLVDYFQAAPSRLVDQLTDPNVEVDRTLVYDVPVADVEEAKVDTRVQQLTNKPPRQALLPAEFLQ